MIVLEGLDGSGKSTLAQRLSEDLQLPIHERASSSIKGPVRDLWSWTIRDVHTLHEQPAAIYDRHPFVSNYIYGPIIHGRIQPEFLDDRVRAVYQKWMQNVLVIFCDPGDEPMGQNLASDTNQMPGVAEHFQALSLAYRAYFATYGGSFHHWDYTRPRDYEYMICRIKQHLLMFNARRNTTTFLEAF
ncbi:MAG: hypothetical protein AB7L09_21995 [Nitrospira sp.]